jgi:Fe2+ transport system protein FeoA
MWSEGRPADSVEVRVKRYCLVLRKEEAKAIGVEVTDT